jgi:arginine decarboxylase
MNSLPLPTTFTLVAGAAEGESRLNAFDNALLAAGIGDLNLVKISSVLPAGAREVPKITAPPGSLVPTAYGAAESQVAGETIAAAVAVGLPADGGSGVIFEFAGRTSAQEAERAVRRMAEVAFAQRGRPLREIRSVSVEHTVRRLGCALAAVALGYDE